MKRPHSRAACPSEQWYSVHCRTHAHDSVFSPPQMAAARKGTGDVSRSTGGGGRRPTSRQEAGRKEAQPCLSCLGSRGRCGTPRAHQSRRLALGIHMGTDTPPSLCCSFCTAAGGRQGRFKQAASGRRRHNSTACALILSSLHLVTAPNCTPNWTGPKTKDTRAWTGPKAGPPSPLPSLPASPFLGAVGVTRMRLCQAAASPSQRGYRQPEPAAC